MPSTYYVAWWNLENLGRNLYDVRKRRSLQFFVAATALVLALVAADVVLGDGERAVRRPAAVSPLQQLRLGMSKAVVEEKLGPSAYVGHDALAVPGRRDCHVYAVAGGAYSLCFRNGLLARVDPVAPVLGEASIAR